MVEMADHQDARGLQAGENGFAVSDRRLRVQAGLIQPDVARLYT